MSNSDAWRWHRRSENFYQSLRSGNLKGTYQRYHPGVTLMWLTSGIKVGMKVYSNVTNTTEKTFENVEDYILIDGLNKITLIIILFGLLLVQYKFIGLLFNRTVGLFYVFFISFEPYLVGINRWYHLTSLESFLSFTAFLSGLLWYKTNKNSYLTMSGLFMGLAVLTKFSSLVVLFLLLIVVVAGVWNRSYSLAIRELVQKAALLIVSCMAVFILLFPALWVAPGFVLQNIFTAGIGAVGGEYDTVLFAERNPLLFYPLILLFKLSPFAIAALLICLIKLRKFSKVKYPELLMLFSYFIVHLIIFAFSEQKIERYIIVLVPAILLLGAFAVSQVNSYLRYALLLGSALFGVFMFIKFYPVNSLYYSPVFGGVKTAARLEILDNNGEYAAQAALYLNKKGRDTRVFVPNNILSFVPYFKGNLESEFSRETEYVIESADSSPREKIPSCLYMEKVYKIDSLPILTILRCKE